MAIYSRNQSAGGKWVDKKELKNGTKAVIVSGTAPIPSNFTDDDGKTKNQDVCKVRFEGQEEAVNVA